MSDDESPAIIASGGWCAPADQSIYGDAAPFSLPEIQALRGGFRWPTPEEAARINAERKAQYGPLFDAAHARHANVMGRLHAASGISMDRMAGEALMRIAERHKPREYSQFSYAFECSCVHESGYEWEPGEWPCQDFEDVARAVGL